MPPSPMPWPTADMLARAGFTRCKSFAETGCTVFVDPANVPSRLCGAHLRAQRAQRIAERDRPRP